MTLPARVGASAINATDGSAVDTGVTFECRFDGAAFGAPTNSPGHVKNGWWEVPLTTAERASGQVVVQVSGTGVIPESRDYVAIDKQVIADAMRVTPTGTVNTDSVDDKLDTILAAIQQAVPVEKTRDSDVLTTGTQTGTSANTLVRDGTYWQITSVAAGINAELVFNIGTADENPSTVELFGRFDSGKDRQVVVQGFNFALNAWEKLGLDVMSNENSDKSYIWGLGRSFVRRGQAGTPGSDGDVRVRFLYDTTVSNKVQAGDNLYLDKVAVYYTSETITIGEIVQALVEANPNRNYPNSAITIDTESGQPGQQFGVNGTPGNPSGNLADAIALATTGGYSMFVINGNSSLTLTQAFPDWTFIMSQGSSLALNGQDVDNSTFVGGTLSGVGLAASSGIRVIGARLNGVTCWGTFRECMLPITDSLIANGAQVYLLECESVRPGGVNPSIKGGSVAGLSLSVIKYGGGIDIGALANDAEVTISGRGSFTLTDAATTADIIASGHMRRLGALPTGVNFIDEARVTQTTGMNVGALAGSTDDATRLQKNVSATETATVNDAGATATTFVTTLTATAPNAYKGRPLTFTTGALADEMAEIEAYNPGTKAVTLVAGHLSGAPANGDEFVVT